MNDIYVKVAISEGDIYMGKLLQYMYDKYVIIQRNKKDITGLIISEPYELEIMGTHEKEWFIETKWEGDTI